jgi:hypothetical protein
MKPDVRQLALLKTKGPFPFITRRIYRHLDGTLQVWSSRRHRKGIGVGRLSAGSVFWVAVWRSLWMVHKINWWIGSLFALGSALFVLGSVLSLWPGFAQIWQLSAEDVNLIYFFGSIPFTTAAYLQLHQAAQSERTAIHQRDKNIKSHWIGWYPSSVGWLSAATQFLGTLLFNVSTYDAQLPHLDRLQQDQIIWAPDFAGSVLFLISGYLAYIEFGHSYWVWNPARLSWWVVTINLLGCIAFMVSAFFAFIPSAPSSLDDVTVSVSFTLAGGVFFLGGSLLMLPESAVDTVE